MSDAPRQYPYQESTRRYASYCRSCCGLDVRVTITSAVDRTKEIVILECKHCDVRRGSYERRRKG